MGNNINLKNIIFFIITVSAFMLSYFSWNISKQTSDFIEKRHLPINPPELFEDINSNKIIFHSTNDAKIKNISIVFPSSITNKTVSSKLFSLALNKTTIEALAKKHIIKNLKTEGAKEIQGTRSIPVMINYEAIVNGQKYSLRENKLLMFHYHYHDNKIDVNYSNSIISNRCYYPLKLNHFFIGPFSNSIEYKIKKQDSIDVQWFLEEQLRNVSH
jgi:hypothetical protein